MYGIFTYSWLICMLNVGKYTRPMDAMALLSLVDGFLFWILLASILSGQIIATSHDLTPNGGLVREIPLFQ